MSKPLEYLCLLGISLLGVMIHLLTKAEAIKSRNKAAGLKGSPFVELFQEDYISIIKAIMLNIALLVFYAFAQNRWTEIDFLFGMVMFLFSGYTGSSFVLSLFSKVDKLQKERINNVSILTPNKMEEYIWVLSVHHLDDTTTFQAQNVTATQLAAQTNGEINGLDIIYADEPDIPELTFTKWDDPEVTYLAAPIRKPKIN